MNVLGLDLSLNASGLSPDGHGAVTLAMKPADGDRRYCKIRDALCYYVSARRFALAMIEAVPPYDHASSGLERVHGVGREVLARHDIPFAYVNVTALKAFATGNGRADKSEVMDYVETETGARPADDNQADAWVLRRMGEVFLSVATGGMVGLSVAQLKAIDAIEWPLKPGDPDWPQVYGAIHQKFARKKCKDGSVCLRNGDHWLHPFDMAVCTRPPK